MNPPKLSGCSIRRSIIWGAKAGDYYSHDLQAEIDAVNVRVYENLNNGVYKTGFASTQEAYERGATG